MFKRESYHMSDVETRVEHSLGSINKSSVDVFEVKINGLDNQGKDNCLYLELFINKSELKSLKVEEELDLKKYMYDCLYSVNGSDVEFLLDDVKEASFKKLDNGDIKLFIKITEPNIVAEATLDKSYYLN